MRNDLLYCQSSILKNAPPPPNMVATPRLLPRKFEHLIVIKTNICCIGTLAQLSSLPGEQTQYLVLSVMRMFVAGN